MESKKISFGFSKISKKTEIISKAFKSERNVQLIDCLEDQSIKIKDVIEIEDEPLVIPIQGSSNKLLDEVKKAKEKRTKQEVKEEDEAKPDSELTIDELAARELIKEARSRGVDKNETKVHSLPVTEEKFKADGAIESSLEDYENVPISDYGMAMLRGMNWKEGMPIGRRTKLTEAPKLPELRPKGLGLGANKMVNANKPSKSVDKDGKELQLVKGAFVKIIAGNHRGHYCEVQGLDDENCRIIIKTALTNEVLNVNEFLLVPVSKEEYGKGSRVINNAKYEEYQEKSTRNHGEVSESSRRRSRSRDRHRSSSGSDRSPSRSRKKNKKKSKKNRHKHSDSEDEKRRKHKKNKSRKKKGSDSESDRESRRRDRDRRR